MVREKYSTLVKKWRRVLLELGERRGKEIDE
jgi:hypothetical protein